jgi:hypothetical protein
MASGAEGRRWRALGGMHLKSIRHRAKAKQIVAHLGWANARRHGNYTAVIVAFQETFRLSGTTLSVGGRSREIAFARGKNSAANRECVAPRRQEAMHNPIRRTDRQPIRRVERRPALAPKKSNAPSESRRTERSELVKAVTRGISTSRDDEKKKHRSCNQPPTLHNYRGGEKRCCTNYCNERRDVKSLFCVDEKTFGSETIERIGSKTE